MHPTGRLVLICKALWALFHGSLMHTFDPLGVFKWFTGCKPGNTQRDDSLLSLNDQMNCLGDSTELSRMGLSQPPWQPPKLEHEEEVGEEGKEDLEVEESPLALLLASPPPTSGGWVIINRLMD
jgi:hypothetical protein